jgi:hypothetical protein
MDDTKFWSMIESAWKSAGGKTKVREQLLTGKISDSAAEELADSLEEMISALREQLEKLPAKELIAFDRIMERKLYDIDRKEIQEHTDGSDDGFLYARGFVIAAGKPFYDAVNAKPSVGAVIAEGGLECEEICYLSWHLYEEKYGEIPDSGISRESCSNKAGWEESSSS